MVVYFQNCKRLPLAPTARANVGRSSTHRTIDSSSSSSSTHACTLPPIDERPSPVVFRVTEAMEFAEVASVVIRPPAPPAWAAAAASEEEPAAVVAAARTRTSSAPTAATSALRLRSSSVSSSAQNSFFLSHSSSRSFLLLSASTRFVKCDKCARFFVILSENDLHKGAAGKEGNHQGVNANNASPHFHKSTEKFNIQRNPPPPKKVSAAAAAVGCFKSLAAYH